MMMAPHHPYIYEGVNFFMRDKTELEMVQLQIDELQKGMMSLQAQITHLTNQQRLSIFEKVFSVEGKDEPAR